MPKIKTNFIELLFYGVKVVDLTVYDDEDQGIVIDNINFQPQIGVVLVEDITNNVSAKLSLEQNYDFEVDNKTFKKIFPNHKKIQGGLARE